MAEATVVQKLNQGMCTDVLYPHPCLNFLLLFLSREKVKRKDKKQIKWNSFFCIIWQPGHWKNMYRAGACIRAISIAMRPRR